MTLGTTLLKTITIIIAFHLADATNNKCIQTEYDNNQVSTIYLKKAKLHM